MDLTAFASVSFDDATSGLLKDLDETARQINEVRPISPEVMRQVGEGLLGERVYSSNAIEGNTLSLRETVAILQAALTFDIWKRKRREAQEAVNLRDSYKRIEKIATDSAAAFDQRVFLEVHELLMNQVHTDIAGRYRTQDVMITGAKHQPPRALDAGPLMDSLFEQLKQTQQNSHGLLLATWTHWAITRVHPFEDGNGRMARLWQDLILLKHGLTVAIIRPEDRRGYYQSLTAADDGNFNPLAQLICQRVMATFQVYLNAQDAADSLRGWAEQVTGEVAVRDTERNRLDYQRWRHHLERLSDAFLRCAALISRSGSPRLEVEVTQYNIIEQETWESLRAGGRAPKTWFLKLLFRRNERSIWYYLFFGRHWKTEVDETIALPGATVGILVSEQSPGQVEAVRLDSLPDTPISLRELIIVENRLVRKRWDSQLGELVYDENVPPVTVAKEFLEEVIFKKLL